MKKHIKTKQLDFDLLNYDCIPKPMSEESISTPYHHSGLMQYLFLCWAKEKGVVLRPDMIFGTILSELSILIHKSPKDYARLLGVNPGDPKVELVTTVPYPTPETFADILYPRLDLVFKLLFSEGAHRYRSAPEGFKQHLMTLLTDCAAPFYSYISTKCGIPSIKFVGSPTEWLQLTEDIKALMDCLVDCTTNTKPVLSWLDECKTLVEKLKDPNTSDSFLMSIFNYNYTPAVSGQSPIQIDGWARQFYYDKMSKKVGIQAYPSHIASMGYKYIDSDPYEYYVWISGMMSSVEEDQYLVPKYNSFNYKLEGPDNEDIFKAFTD